MDKKQYFFRILILGFLTALVPFSIDMYLPGFGDIAKDLHTTTNEVSFSLSSFFIGVAFGQLLYGPLLDRFGRKKPLYIGLVLYILSSIGCLTVASVNGLIILRVVEAIGGCAASVAAVAMVRDLFPVEDNAKVFSLLMLVVGASPMLAPYVGGQVANAFGWQWIFVTLAFIAFLILIAVTFKLPESYQPDKSISLKPLPILGNFMMVLKEPQFYTYSFAGSLAFSGLFAYVAGAPLVFMDIYHLGKTQFGEIFAALSVAFIGCSQLNTLAMRRYKSEQLVKAALFVQVITGVLFVTFAINGWVGLGTTIAFVALFLCCLGFISSNASALAIAPFAKNAGSASSLMGAVQLGLGALTSSGIGWFKSYTTIPLAALMAGTSFLALMVLLIGSRYIRHKVEVRADAAVMTH